VDVRRRSNLSDYGGELLVAFGVRITDRWNGEDDGAGGTHPATAEFPGQGPLSASVACAPTADDAVGSTCLLSTSANALLPGAVREGKRSVWELDQITVYDAGQDGDIETLDDNQTFAKQGIFVP
jgi:hypothetical protein